MLRDFLFVQQLKVGFHWERIVSMTYNLTFVSTFDSRVGIAALGPYAPKELSSGGEQVKTTGG